MARQLWLLRHGDAEPHGTREDAERRLTERGAGQAHAAGIALQRLGAHFDAALFSPKTRARRTAELAAEHWSEQQRELLAAYPPLAGGFDARQALDELAGLPADGRLLLVGHEPDLSGVVGDLTGARPDLKKGGLAVVKLESAAGGELVVLLRPRELALIAGGEGGVPVDGD
ncbi:MAG TPA: phosphohistidine phosphatase SixA [Solirubrobacteraceae bacterium]|jgi:phosphohistidine phosphatase